MIDVNYLKECFEYVDGDLFWKVRPRHHFKSKRSQTRVNNIHAGNAAGRVFGDGYRQVYVNGCGYLAHRIVWLMATGSEPKGNIDHINGNRSDNRVENLRDVPQSDNQKNRGISSNNTSGVSGVYYEKARKKWKATVYAGGKRAVQKRFNTLDDASEFVQFVRSELGFSDRHGF